jgi:hypothetical protein
MAIDDEDDLLRERGMRRLEKARRIMAVQARCWQLLEQLMDEREDELVIRPFLYLVESEEPELLGPWWGHTVQDPPASPT